jgi:hypothetical protein
LYVDGKGGDIHPLILFILFELLVSFAAFHHRHRTPPTTNLVARAALNRPAGFSSVVRFG